MTHLFVHESGDPAGPPIVFLHGGGLSGRMWQPQVDALREFHCLAPDLPEHGRSAAVTPFTLRSAAEALSISFDGFAEADKLCRGDIDVVVTDGFSGNIALKSVEGTARFVADLRRIVEHVVDITGTRRDGGIDEEAAHAHHGGRIGPRTQFHQRKIRRNQEEAFCSVAQGPLGMGHPSTAA